MISDLCLCNLTVSSSIWNLFARVSFSKSWNCTSRFGKCNYSFLKNSQEEINFKLSEKKGWFLINKTNMKNSPEKVSEDVSWNHFFRIRVKFFQKICTYFFVIALHEIIGLQNFHCLSANHNPELRCVICTGVTLFALFSANQNRVIFSGVLFQIALY